MAFRPGVKRPLSACNFAQPDTEDKKLRKELTLEVPCFEGTLRKQYSDPNEIPWPGQLRTFQRS
jgi:hypothetical protein